MQVWWNAVKMRPSVAATFVCPERLIASYAQYAANEATSDFSHVMASVISSANAASAQRASPDGAGSSRALAAPHGGAASSHAAADEPMTAPARPVGRSGGAAKARGSGSGLRTAAAFALGAASTLLVQRARAGAQ